ncbi:MAG: hypothetical protein ACYSR6_09780 [Planctomycetota bacterium]|jgi:hypothetical protein
MAKAMLRSIILNDLWPGSPNPNLGIPTDGWDSTTGGNKSTTAIYPVGTKISAYHDGTPAGLYTMIYLRFFEGSGELPTLAGASAGNNFVTIGDATYAPDGTGIWWNVTNHATISCATHDWAPLACAVAALVGDGTLTATAATNAEYGWFWCGGVCPASLLTCFSDGEFTGVGTHMSGICIVNDSSMIEIGGFTAGDGTCNCVGFITETAD